MYKTVIYNVDLDLLSSLEWKRIGSRLDPILIGHNSDLSTPSSNTSDTNTTSNSTTDSTNSNNVINTAVYLQLCSFIGRYAGSGAKINIESILLESGILGQPITGQNYDAFSESEGESEGEKGYNYGDGDSSIVMRVYPTVANPLAKDVSVGKYTNVPSSTVYILKICFLL